MTAKLALAQTACLSVLRQSNKCTGVELDPVPFKNTSLSLTHREGRIEELRDPGLCARDIPSREKTLPLETTGPSALRPTRRISAVTANRVGAADVPAQKPEHAGTSRHRRCFESASSS